MGGDGGDLALRGLWTRPEGPVQRPLCSALRDSSKEAQAGRSHHGAEGSLSIPQPAALQASWGAAGVQCQQVGQAAWCCCELGMRESCREERRSGGSPQGRRGEDPGTREGSAAF